MTLINTLAYHTKVLIIGCQGKPLRVIFVGKAWSIPLVGAKLALLKNIGLGWK